MKGGLAQLDFDFTGFATINGVYIGGDTRSGLRTGWTTGAGVEYALARSWSARLDYDFFDFGTKGYLFNGATLVELQPRLHTIRVGISYQFNLLP